MQRLQTTSMRFPNGMLKIPALQGQWMVNLPRTIVAEQRLAMARREGWRVERRSKVLLVPFSLESLGMP